MAFRDTRTPEERPGIPNQWDDYQTNYPEPSGGGSTSGGCPDGKFEIDIDENGKTKAAPDGECVDQAEASKRNKLWVAQNPGPGGEKTGPAGPDPNGGPQRPPFAPKLPNVPQFHAPTFDWTEQFRWPTPDEALSDPGYQFRLKEGERALQQSAAGKGTLRTGGTLKDILNYGQSAASQEYGNVADRYLTGYKTRFDTARNIFDTKYTGAKDEFSPNLLAYQNQYDANKLALQKMWDDYFHNTVDATTVYKAGFPGLG